MTLQEDVDTARLRVKRLTREGSSLRDTQAQLSRAMVVYAKAAAAQVGQSWGEAAPVGGTCGKLGRGSQVGRRVREVAGGLCLCATPRLPRRKLLASAPAAP